MSHLSELVTRSSRNVWQLASASWGHAQQGWARVSWGVWIGVTAAIVLYLPYERALEADTRAYELQSQSMGVRDGGEGRLREAQKRLCVCVCGRSRRVQAMAGGAGSAGSAAIFTGGQ